MTEHDEQVALFEWAAYAQGERPELRWLFAIPNGGLRNIRVAMNLKTEGVKPGVPDIFLAYPVNQFHGLFVEMKTDKGRVSPEQKEWLRILSSQGYIARVCRGFEDAKRTILDYLAVELEEMR